MTEKQVTTYLGFSKVKGTMSIPELVNAIRSEKYNRIITRIRYLRDLGNTDEMNRVKRQLEFFTVTTQYGTHRKPDGIIRHNNLITIDIDGLTDEQVIRLRPVIEADPATIFSFLTAKQHGFKIIAYLETAAIRELRKIFCYMPEMTYEQLETYHAQAYELTRTHYENVLNVPVDTSGKDLSRGIFASYDPDAFFLRSDWKKRLPFLSPTLSLRRPQGRAGKNKRSILPAKYPRPSMIFPHPSVWNTGNVWRVPNVPSSMPKVVTTPSCLPWVINAAGKVWTCRTSGCWPQKSLVLTANGIHIHPYPTDTHTMTTRQKLRWRKFHPSTKF